MAFTETVTRTAASAIVGTGESSFLNFIQEEFAPKWEDHIHKKIIIAGLIAKKKGTMGGRRTLSAVKTKLPQSSGIALFEGDDLPTPDTSSAFNPTLFARSIYARLRWTGHVERSSKKNSWAQARAEDIKGMREQFELNFARMLYLGKRQVLGQVLSYEESGDASMTLYSRDARTSAAADRNKYGAHYLRVGQRLSTVATIDAAETNQSDNIAVTSIDTSSSEPVVGLSAAYNTNPTDTSALIVPKGSRRSSMGSDDAERESKFAGINGLMDLATDRNICAYLYGISRATEPSLEGRVYNNGSGGLRAFDENLINLCVDDIADKGTGDDPTDLVVHKSVRREYVKAVQGDRRFPEVIKTRGYGTLKQQVGDNLLPLHTDRDCMPGVMWVLELDGFGWLSQSDMGSVDDGERFVTDKDAHEMVFHKSGNAYTKTPFNNGMIDDIAFSTSGLTEVA